MRVSYQELFSVECLHGYFTDHVCQALTLRRHAGYDHGYYFIASFIEDHLRHHAAQLSA